MLKIIHIQKLRNCETVGNNEIRKKQEWYFYKKNLYQLDSRNLLLSGFRFGLEDSISPQFASHMALAFINSGGVNSLLET